MVGNITSPVFVWVPEITDDADVLFSHLTAAYVVRIKEVLEYRSHISSPLGYLSLLPGQSFHRP